MAKLKADCVADVRRIISRMRGEPRRTADSLLMEWQIACRMVAAGHDEGRRAYWLRVADMRLSRLKEFLLIGSE